MPDRKTPVEYLSKFTGILIGSGYVEDFANRYADAVVVPFVVVRPPRRFATRCQGHQPQHHDYS